MRTVSVAEFMDILNKPLGFRAVSHYGKHPKLYLASLCDKYGSDKGEVQPGGHPYGWPSHTYADYYARLYDHCRGSVTKVFECGLGTNNTQLLSHMGANGRPGASLRVWRDYFPNAQIFGADIDRDILFEEERIKTFYVDQTDPAAIAAMWEQVGETDFDFILDDGLHTYEAGLCLFEHSIDKLAPNGIYVIEDVKPQALLSFRDYFLNKPYQVDIVSLLRPNTVLDDNSLVVIRKIDPAA